MRRVTVWIGLVVPVLAAVLLAGTVRAGEFSGTFSGWGVANDTDANSDGVTGFDGTYQGNSSFGRYTQNTYSETDFGVFGGCGVNHVAFEFPVFSTIMRLANGDLLYLARDSVEGPSLCLDVTNGTFVNSGRLQIVGGTGRFSGAYGFVRLEGVGQSLLSSPTGGIQSSGWGTFAGEIFFD